MNEPKKMQLLDIMFKPCQIYNKSRLKTHSFKGINIKERKKRELPFLLTVLNKSRKEELSKESLDTKAKQRRSTATSTRKLVFLRNTHKVQTWNIPARPNWYQN